MTRLFLLVSLIPAAFVVQLWTVLAPQRAGSVAVQAELIFSHQYHLEEEGLLCDDCHEGVEESAQGLDNLLPPMEKCADCHEVEDFDECGMCHSDEDDPREVPRIETYSPVFSHEQHLGTGLECENCHAEIAAKDIVEPYALPTMVNCQDCHDDGGVSVECRTCHLPSERLTPLSHTPAFAHTHGDAARHAAQAVGDAMTCQTCHDDDFCQDCHEGDNLERLTHPLNYAFTHALDAQSNETACVACHSDRQFCADCHIENQVLPHTHTPGWANAIDGGRHRLEALSDLDSCIACHESNADQVCQPCHGGF